MGHESDDTTYNNNYGKDCTITAVYHLDKETGRKRFKEFPNRWISSTDQRSGSDGMELLPIAYWTMDPWYGSNKIFEGDIFHVRDKNVFSAKDWDEFLCQLQQKFNLQKPVMKNYRIDYQIKDKDGKLSPECYGLTEDDEFQYALTGID